MKKRVEIKKVFISIFFISIFLLIYISLGFTYVVGRSMEGTMKDGEILLIDKLYKEEEIKRGDIAILDIDYKGKKTRIVKRIVGMEGDVLEFKDNQLYINNIRIKETYVKEQMKYKNQKFTVPKGSVFLMGDNRKVSLDSRSETIGYIEFKKSIYGKVIFNISNWEKV